MYDYFSVPDPRFVKLIQNSHEENGCRIWDGYCNEKGYGFVGRHKRAHRESYELLSGPIPDGFELDHLCKNRNCIRVEHLEVVTHAENLSRRAPHGSYVPRKPTWRRRVKLVVGDTCRNGHMIESENNLLFEKNDVVRCKTCRHRQDHDRYKVHGKRGGK